MLSVIHARMLERLRTHALPSARNGSSRSTRDHEPRLIELLNPLMGVIVLPYLGHRRASRGSSSHTDREASARTPILSGDTDDTGLSFTR